MGEGSGAGEEVNMDDRARDDAGERADERGAGETAAGLVLPPLPVEGAGGRRHQLLVGIGREVRLNLDAPSDLGLMRTADDNGVYQRHDLAARTVPDETDGGIDQRFEIQPGRRGDQRLIIEKHADPVQPARYCPH
jgi:hypothetical protein